VSDIGGAGNYYLPPELYHTVKFEFILKRELDKSDNKSLIREC